MPKINGSSLLIDENMVKESSDHLSRLMRLILFSLQISSDEFLDRYRRFYRSVLSVTDQTKYLQKGTSDRRIIVDGKSVTFSMMRNVLTYMGYDITEVSIKVRDKATGEIKEFSTSQTVDELKADLEDSKKIGIDSIQS